MAADFSGQGLVTSVAGNDQGSSTKIAFTRGSLKYDSPFLDMTSTFIPRTIKAILRFVAAYVVGDGLVSACITKLAEYPITTLIYGDQDNKALKDDKTIIYWKNLLEKKLKILRVLKQSGMDYYAYGNSIVSINYPFSRVLKCPRCKKEHFSDALKPKFKNFEFHAQCMEKSCRYNGKMEAFDRPTKEIDKLSIVHWDIMCLDIKYNGITGDHFYYYTIPADLGNAIRRGDMDIIKNTRLEVIEAVKRRKQLKLMADNVFHLKRPAPQYIIPSERGWGIPVVMPIMKDIFHNRILKKGNEMIAFDHIVPLRIMFPQGTGDVSPHATINLSGWKTKIEGELQKWRVDPNYISIVPIPIGIENFAGDAKLLMVTQEIKATEDNIIIGTGIIPEIVRGGASWSGSNVSLRVVENSFLNHRDDSHELMDWIIDKASIFLDKPRIDIRMSDFKMADDLQKKQLMVNAALGSEADSLISQTTVIEELDFDPQKEYKRKEEELKRRIELRIKETEGLAEAQGAGNLISAMYQADAQMESQSRIEMHQLKNQEQRDKMNAQRSEQNSQGVVQEVDSLAQQGGQSPQSIALPNLILVLTQRFARLASIDKNEFKIRMLAMKNSMPNLYEEIFTNLKEMNLIEADLAPSLATVGRFMPGQIPSNAQGDVTAETPPDPVEIGANPGAIAALPEVRPPRSVAASPI
jgi:hypothetical protein